MRSNPKAPPSDTAPQPRVYLSPSMVERRQRILTEAQALLAEKGVEGFTIRDLHRRAAVAQRTLYNVFGSKEEIVARAIEHHFTDEQLELPPVETAELELILRRIDVLSRIVIRQRAYASGLVSVFFSPTLDRRIYDSLHRIALSGTRAWLDAAEREKVLRKLSTAERRLLLTSLVNLSYATISDWAAGRIEDSSLSLASQLNFLIGVSSCLTSKHRKIADALIAARAQLLPADYMASSYAP